MCSQGGIKVVCCWLSYLVGWVITVMVKLHDQMIFGLSIACPLEIMSCSNAFSTPLEIVPELYLLLCFNLLRIVTSKGIGVS